MTNIKKFIQSFKMQGENADKEAYSRLNDILVSINACTHVAPGCYYIIDFCKLDFYHVFENNCYLCGYTPKEVKRMGLDFYFKCVPSRESRMLCEVTRAGFEYFHQLPEQDKMDYSFQFNFHLQKGRFQILVNHQVTPLKLCNGRLWLALCVLTPAACPEEGRVFLHKRKGIRTTCLYSLKEKTWREYTFIRMSDMEKRIILCELKGMSIQETANEVYRGIDAVKKARKKLLQKSGAKNFKSFCQLVLQHQLI